MSGQNYSTRAIAYANRVVGNPKLAGPEIRQAARRFLNDLGKVFDPEYPFYYDPEAANKPCQFIEMLPHVKGKWRTQGLTITLEDWQCFIVCNLFGWLQRRDGKRRFREFFGLIPRKNAKSTLAAGIALYLFLFDKEGAPEIFSGATSLAQAQEVFRPAWMMLKALPALTKRFGITLGGTERNPGTIYCMATGGRFEPVVGKPGDGASPHCGVVDEYHEHKDDHLVDCFGTGMGAREQPLLLKISTAGVDFTSPCYTDMLRAKEVLDGVFVDDRLFIVIFTIDPKDDWTDYEVWKKANPNYGVSVFDDFLRKQYDDAMNRVNKRNMIKCKHLNIFCNVGTAFFDMLAYDECLDANMKLEDFHGKVCYLGLDLASRVSLAAKMYMFKKGKDYYLFSKYYYPERQAQEPQNHHYATWAEEGYLELTDGDSIDIEMIQESIKEDAKKVNLRGHEKKGGEVCNDPWNAIQLINNLNKVGVAVTEIPQTVNFLSAPMKEFDALIRDGRLHHDGNPITKWCFSNVVAKFDAKENVFPRKVSGDSKIDGAVAAMNALCRAAQGVGSNAGKTKMPRKIG